MASTPPTPFLSTSKHIKGQQGKCYKTTSNITATNWRANECDRCHFNNYEINKYPNNLYVIGNSSICKAIKLVVSSITQCKMTCNKCAQFNRSNHSNRYYLIQK